MKKLPGGWYVRKRESATSDVTGVRCSDCGWSSFTDPCYYCEELARVRLAPEHPVDGVPSTLVHRTYRKDGEWASCGYDEYWYERITYCHVSDAQLVSSELQDGSHAPVLDVDFPAALVESSTPGHYHLYLDKPMPWPKYKRLMKALARAGILERGYVKESLKRKHSALRLPWVRK